MKNIVKIMILLSIELHNGLSFPKARELALNKYLKTDKISNLLGSSNNILGIEYIKALRKYKSSIVPFTLQRFNTNYNDFNINRIFNNNNSYSK